MCIGVSRPCLRLNRLAAVVFVHFGKKGMPEFNMSGFVYDNLYLCYCLLYMRCFVENTKQTSDAKIFTMVADLFLISHIHPIGDQSDVQDLAMFVNMLCEFGISGTVPTYVLHNTSAYNSPRLIVIGYIHIYIYMKLVICVRVYDNDTHNVFYTYMYISYK